MSEAATAIMEAQDTRRLDYAMKRLLNRLRRFMAAYPREMDKPMPDHDLVWMERLNGDGPARVILDAIKSHPDLWRDALPPDVCIVPRKALEQTAGLSPEVVDYLAGMGENMVAAHAARHEHEAMTRDIIEDAQNIGTGVMEVRPDGTMERIAPEDFYLKPEA